MPLPVRRPARPLRPRTARRASAARRSCALLRRQRGRQTHPRQQRPLAARHVVLRQGVPGDDAVQLGGIGRVGCVAALLQRGGEGARVIHATQRRCVARVVVQKPRVVFDAGLPVGIFAPLRRHRMPGAAEVFAGRHEHHGAAPALAGLDAEQVVAVDRQLALAPVALQRGLGQGDAGRNAGAALRVGRLGADGREKVLRRHAAGPAAGAGVGVDTAGCEPEQWPPSWKGSSRLRQIHSAAVRRHPGGPAM